MAAAAGSGSRKPGSPRDSESEVWSRRVRELISSEPASRLCFECGQRGVTYVDITIGSFVCTTCSGALRGLNPPHRVKSISMTTFTENEVQFLQSRGNEACRKIWLSSFDSRTSLLPDSQDPQKVKEFLQEKYEKKRWYISPDQAKNLASPAVQSGPAEVKTLLGQPAAKTLQAPEKASLQAAWPSKKASTDLLADIGGDPFAAPPPGPAFPAFGGQPPAFSSFDAFGGSPVASASAFGDPAASGQSLPFLTGGAQMEGFPTGQPGMGLLSAAGAFTFPTGQPGMGLLSAAGAFRAGGIPPSIFGVLHQPPALPPPGPMAAFGVPACTNPFAAPAPSQPALPPTNPFQSNGLATDASFSGFPAAVVGQRPFGPPAGLSTNPFVSPMAVAPSPPFTLTKHPPTNPFS